MHSMQRPPMPRIDRRHPLANGLVFAGLGGGASTNMYADASGYNNFGTLTGMDPATDWVWSDYLQRWVLDFDGSDDAVIKAAPSFTATFPFSLACWAKIRSAYRSAANGKTYFIQASLYGGSAESIFSLATDYSTSADKVYYFQANAVRLSTNTFVVDAWQHFAISFDSSTQVRLWINGTPGVIDQPIATFVVGAGSVYLGALNGTLSPCPCTLADPVMYKGGFSTSLVQILANPDPMLGGLILPPKRKLWTVGGGGAPAAKYWLWARQHSSQVIGGGVS